MIQVFISYSHDNGDHEEWVASLADSLEEFFEFNIKFDKYDLDLTTEKNFYMEKSIRESDFIIAVVSEQYAKKANLRKAGVGTETILAAALHYKEIEEYGSSKIITILKNNDSEIFPTYLLNNKLRINFDTGDFDTKFLQLTNMLSGNFLRPRPNKIKSIESNPIKKSFKSADAILSINNKNRKLIPPLKEETSKNAKFEFWECHNPATQYFLILFPNKNLRESINSFINSGIKIPNEITILKERESNTCEKILEELLLNDKPIIHEFSYSKYFWEWCIEQDFKKTSLVSDEPNYITQDLYDFYTDEYIRNGFLEEYVNNDHSSPILMLLATAGKGKTTLVEKLIDVINQYKEKKCVYISSENFKEYYTDYNTLSEINSIYDLYNTFVSVNKESYHLDENIFNIGLSHGNILVIIDGLDEIITLYQEKFKLLNFLDSLIKLNQEFGKSKIIISSREYYWKDNNLLKEKNIIALRLKGFNETHVRKYLKKRYELLEKKGDFFNWEKESVYKNSVLKYVEEILHFTKNELISPFLIDILCASVEVEMKKELNTLQLPNQYTYPCNDSVIDKIICAIVNREIVRQRYEYLEAKDLINIFIELAVTYGETFSIKSLEYMLESKYSNLYKQISNSLKFTQLFEVNSSKISFKYDILVNYFVCLSILKMFSSFDKSDIFKYQHLVKLHKKGNPICKEIIKYFTETSTRQELFQLNAQLVVKYLISEYRHDNTNDTEKNEIENALYSILFLLMKIYNADKLSNKKRMELIMNLYQMEKNRVEYLFIFDNFYSLDFSFLEIWNSKFVSYKQFLNSDFNETKFYYTFIKNLQANKQDKNKIEAIIFDETCELYELKAAFDMNSYQKSSKKLLSIFKKFYDNQFKQIHIHKRNNKDDCLTPYYIDHLTQRNFIELVDVTPHTMVYQIIEDKKPSVKKFIKEDQRQYDIIELITNVYEEYN